MSEYISVMWETGLLVSGIYSSGVENSDAHKVLHILYGFLYHRKSNPFFIKMREIT